MLKMRDPKRRSFLMPGSKWKRDEHRLDSDLTWHSSCSDISSELNFRAAVPVDRSIGAVARAVTHIRLRIHARQRTPQAVPSEPSKVPLPSAHPHNDCVHLDDMFHSRLNQCNPEALFHLRERRANISPITCRESDSGDDAVTDYSTHHQGLGLHEDIALQSRLDALRLQQELLGFDHPDVLFLAQHIRQHRRRQSSVSGDSRSSQQSGGN
jgi:hypothetical protein